MTKRKSKSKRKSSKISPSDDSAFQGKEIYDLKNVDVLLGRGNGIATFEGNVHFRRIVWDYRHAYESTDRMKKQEVAMMVIRDVHKAGGRFVCIAGTEIQGGREIHFYREVAVHRAIEKTCQALREKKNKPPSGTDTQVTLKDQSVSDKKSKRLSEKAVKSRPSKKTKIPDWSRVEGDESGVDDDESYVEPPKKKVKTITKGIDERLLHTLVTPKRLNLSRKTVLFDKSSRAREAAIQRQIVVKNPAVNVNSDCSLESKFSETKLSDNGDFNKAIFNGENTADFDDHGMIDSAANNVSGINARYNMLDKAVAEPLETMNLDSGFSELPPELTAFFSGIYSNYLEGVVHTPGTVDHQPGKASPLPSAKKFGRPSDQYTTESPTTVMMDFMDQPVDPPPLAANHSLKFVDTYDDDIDAFFDEALVWPLQQSRNTGSLLDEDSD